MRKIPRITDKFARGLNNSETSPILERKGPKGAEHLTWNSALSNEDLMHADALIIDLDTAQKNQDCTQGAGSDAATLSVRLREGASIVLVATHSETIRQEAASRVAILNVLADCLLTPADQLRKLSRTPTVSRKERPSVTPAVETTVTNSDVEAYKMHREAFRGHIASNVWPALFDSTKSYFSSGKNKEFLVKTRHDFVVDFLKTCQDNGISDTMRDPNNSENTITLQDCLDTLVNSPFIQNRIQEDTNQNRINGEVKMRIGKITHYAETLAENVQPSHQSPGHKVTLLFSSTDEHNSALVKTLTEEARALLKNDKVEIKEGDPFVIARQDSSIAPKKTAMHQTKARVHSNPDLGAASKKPVISKGRASWTLKSLSTSAIKPKNKTTLETETKHETSPVTKKP